MAKSCEKTLLFCLIYVSTIFTLYIYNKYGSHPNDNYEALPCRHTEDSIDTNLVPVPIYEIMSGEPHQLPQNDPRLIKYIWDNALIEPPSDDEYNIVKPGVNPSMGQGQFIQKVFKNMRGGFFIEAGALDGETRSNTLYLEMHMGWKGLLVEGDPSNYALVKGKHRKAWTSNTCLAIKPHPHKAEFMQSFNVGKILASDAKDDPKTANKEVVTVQCMPIFSLLSALNVTTVDYFSLDVEGSELKVLKTIPFQEILIKTLSVEFIHTTEGKDNLLEYMESQGYTKIGEVTHKGGLANDYMFAHNTVTSTV